MKTVHMPRRKRRDIRHLHAHQLTAEEREELLRNFRKDPEAQKRAALLYARGLYDDVHES